MLKALNVTELFKPLKALIVKFLKISPVIRPLNPKESNGPLIDNKIFNGLRNRNRNLYFADHFTCTKH